MDPWKWNISLESYSKEKENVDINSEAKLQYVIKKHAVQKSNEYNDLSVLIAIMLSIMFYMNVPHL